MSQYSGTIGEQLPLLFLLGMMKRLKRHRLCCGKNNCRENGPHLDLAQISRSVKFTLGSRTIKAGSTSRFVIVALKSSLSSSSLITELKP